MLTNVNALGYTLLKGPAHRAGSVPEILSDPLQGLDKRVLSYNQLQSHLTGQTHKAQQRDDCFKGFKLFNKKIKVTELMYTYYVCCLWSVCYIPQNASSETKRMNMKIPASLHNTHETRHTCSTLEALLGHFLQCDNTLDMELLIPLYLISYIYLLFIL